MRVVFLVALLASCKHREPAKPAPPPVVHIQRTSPVIGERFTYTVQDSLALVLTDGTNTVSAREENDSQAEEIIEDVRDHIVTARTIRFIAFHHKPLTAEAPLVAPVVGKTYRVRWEAGKRVFSATTDAERAALEAYVRRDTGEPDLATHLLTNHDFERGTPWEIPEGEPAPFARGLHAGASITLTDIDNSVVRFAITQVMLLELRDQHVPITLHGTIVMDIASARIQSIDVEGHITERSGPVAEAHMTSHQTFSYPR